MFFRRGPGQAYLKHALTPELMHIMDAKDLNLEINPLKVYEAYVNEYESKNGKACPLPKKVTPEEAAKEPVIQEIIKPRTIFLLSYGNLIDSRFAKIG